VEDDTRSTRSTLAPIRAAAYGPAMLDGLFIASTVSAVRAALASATATAGKVVVVGDVKLGKALRAEGVPAVVVAAKPPRGVDDAITGAIDRVPLADREAAAVVGVGGVGHPTALAEWCRIVRDRGAVVLVDRGAAEDATRAVLCAGLTEIEQRTAGRLTVTSGLVTMLG
jgi:hypothetical protein